MNQISSIVADNGFVEWNMICFSSNRDYSVYSYFTDEAIMPIFKAVLIAMLKKMGEFPCMKEGKVGNC